MRLQISDVRLYNRCISIAIARPIPRLEPVTIAALPSNETLVAKKPWSLFVDMLLSPSIHPHCAL